MGKYPKRKKSLEIMIIQFADWLPYMFRKTRNIRIVIEKKGSGTNLKAYKQKKVKAW